jgi:rhodanese-related sulfurtransferase
VKHVKLVIPFVLIALLLVACGGQSESADASSTTINVSELPAEVDVETVNEIRNRENVLVLDVREQDEYDEKHIPGVTLLPMSEIQGRLGEIPKDKEVIVTCRSGNRSGQVTQFLSQNGFDNVHNMQGGIIAWEEAGFPVER